MKRAITIKAILGEWRSPRTFEAVLSGIRDCTPGEDLFRNPTINHVHRDLWAACEFARATSSRQLRWVINDRKNADFEVRQRNGDVLRLQFTEAALPADLRKRSAKCSNSGKGNRVEHISPEELWNRRVQIPKLLSGRIISKRERGYPPEVGLLVYLNISTWGKWRSEIERDLVDAAREHGSEFRSVWVFWGGRLYRAWPNPSAGMILPMFPNMHVPQGRWRAHASRRRLEDLFAE